MKTLLVLACLAGYFCVTPARAATIYSTLGSSAPVYEAGTGYLVVGPSGGPPGYVGVAAPFVPSASYDVTFIDLALIHESGTNSAVVELQADASGVPGAVLGSWVVSAVPNAYAEVGVPASGTVMAGQQYWISVLPNASDTLIDWAFNSQGITGTYATTPNGASYSLSNYTLPAFDVRGDSVPEPSTFALGAAAAALLARRVFRR